MIRYETEKKLIAGEIEVDDLPDVWDDMYEEYLGIRAPNRTLGVLQDIHWSFGAFGYFPTYTLETYILLNSTAARKNYLIMMKTWNRQLHTAITMDERKCSRKRKYCNSRRID